MFRLFLFIISRFESPFVFRWKPPDSVASGELRLEICSICGWIGPKRLFMGGTEVFRRGWLEGIHHSFPDHGKPGQLLELKAVQTSEPGQWKPMLTLNDEPVPEETGTIPPHNPQRPKLLAIVTGVTYLAMFMTFIMLPHIQKMLYATYGHSDSRVFVLEVAHKGVEGVLHFDRPALPSAILGQPYETKPAILGGEQPYTFKRLMGIMPDGLHFDDDSGLISGTPRESGDFLIRIRATDARDHSIDWPCVISVASDQEHAPRIVTESLPVAIEHSDYSAQFDADGGLPPYDWVLNKRKLPNGLVFKVLEEDGESGQEQVAARLEGTPEQLSVNEGEVAKSIAGAYPLRVRVTDASYSPWVDISPWVLPFVATSICLLGYWNMQRWSVVLLGLAVLAQIGLAVASLLSVSTAAVVLQLCVLAVGTRAFPKMR
ncbi:MAG: Ig domain-containing protein [Phycisphaerales bacterium]|nr:Ig domain-containing protein [Phycisphaerales bacterium]